MSKNRLDITKVKEKMDAASKSPNTLKKKIIDPIIPTAETANGYSFTEDSVRKVPVRDIDPNKCTPWRYHNRSIDWLNEKYCKDVIESIRKNGQQEPGMVRLLDDGRYEIIYGVRRWFSCKFLNIGFKARVVNKDDRECMILMHVENADSQDISDFERALSFHVQYSSGEFKSKKDMSEALGVSQPTLTRMLSAAELYEHPWIREVLSSPIDIQLLRAHKLSTLLKNTQSREKIRETFEAMKRKIDSGEVVSTKTVFSEVEKSLSSNEDKTLDQILGNLNKLSGATAKVDKSGGITINLARKHLKNKKEIQKKLSEIINLL